jgi:putative sigma-54 modulation protein
MNLQISGHHIEVTPALREYVENKLEPVIRHFDKVTGVSVVLSVEKLKQKAEATLHVPGKDIHVEAAADDLYAAIDTLFVTSNVEQGLARIGVRTVPLGNEELIELFYHIFNPEDQSSAPKT